jgi:hypothetical protein
MVQTTMNVAANWQRNVQFLLLFPNYYLKKYKSTIRQKENKIIYEFNQLIKLSLERSRNYHVFAPYRAK